MDAAVSPELRVPARRRRVLDAYIILCHPEAAEYGKEQQRGLFAGFLGYSVNSMSCIMSCSADVTGEKLAKLSAKFAEPKIRKTAETQGLTAVIDDVACLLKAARCPQAPAPPDSGRKPHKPPGGSPPARDEGAPPRQAEPALVSKLPEAEPGTPPDVHQRWRFVVAYCWTVNEKGRGAIDRGRLKAHFSQTAEIPPLRLEELLSGTEHLSIQEATTTAVKHLELATVQERAKHLGLECELPMRCWLSAADRELLRKQAAERAAAAQHPSGAAESPGPATTGPAGRSASAALAPPPGCPDGQSGADAGHNGRFSRDVPAAAHGSAQQPEQKELMLVVGNARYPTGVLVPATAALRRASVRNRAGGRLVILRFAEAP